MIALILRDWRPRFALVAALMLLIYLLEPGFHEHRPADALEVEMGPLGVSASLAYLAGLSMVVLLAGFISTERREGYTRMFFSHPTSPLAWYGLRWAMAWLATMGIAALFLVFGQLIAWGTFRGGWAGMLLPALTALIYGGLIAFFSAALRRGDAWVVLALFAPTLVPQMLILLEATIDARLYTALTFLLPPQPALQDVYVGLLAGEARPAAIAFAAGYGLVWLLAAALILAVREPAD